MEKTYSFKGNKKKREQVGRDKGREGGGRRWMKRERGREKW
jgi:hypothetical protein